MDDEDAPTDASGKTMLFDYLKQLTSLCLFSLAGVVALAGKLPSGSAVLITIALIVIGIAAFFSFFATGLLVDAQLGGKPTKRDFQFYRHASPLLLSVGIGMILFLFVRSLQP